MTTLEILMAWLPAIAELESDSCRIKVQDLDRPAEERSYGCYGVRLVAYEDALKVDPTLPYLDPEAIMRALRDDPAFNKRVAKLTLRRLAANKTLQGDTCAILTAYNMGVRGTHRWLRKNGGWDMVCESPYMNALRDTAAKMRQGRQ